MLRPATLNRVMNSAMVLPPETVMPAFVRQRRRTRTVTSSPATWLLSLPPEPDAPGLVIPQGSLRLGAREAPEGPYVLTADASLDKPAERLDVARTPPSAQRHKWPGATIVASVAFHAAVALCFMTVKDDGVKIAGADNAGIAMLGNAAENQQAAGDADADGLPVTNVTLVTMLDAKPDEAVEAQQLIEAEPETPAEAVSATPVPVEQAPEQSEPLVHTLAVAESGLVEAAPEEALAPSPAPQILAVEPVAADVKEDAVQQASAVAPPEPVKPIEPVAKLAEVVPAPEPRPAPQARPVEKAEKSQPQMADKAKPIERQKPVEKAAPAKAPRSSGSRGNAAQDTRRGEAAGQQKGTNGIKSQGGTTGVGNAAVSNYPGKIVAKLKRMLRYPAQARRQGIRGETRVSFVVVADGSVSAVRVVGSSGSDILDNAALEAVRRAAPFPPIPDSAGRSSWNFTVPLAFTR